MNLYSMVLLIGSSAMFAATPAHSDAIAEMKALAKQKHYHYLIFCVPTDGHFQAAVCERSCRGPHWLEGWWQAGVGPTQEDAAANLMGKLRNNDWYSPMLPPKPATHDQMEHKQCPPEIEGGPQ